MGPMQIFTSIGLRYLSRRCTCRAERLGILGKSRIFVLVSVEHASLNIPL